MTKPTSEAIQEESGTITFAEFLEGIPPGNSAAISDMVKERRAPNGSVVSRILSTPEIQLHCPSESCNGLRFFRRSVNADIEFPSKQPKLLYLTYACSNCRQSTKTFSLRVIRDADDDSGTCFKFGEAPAYGQPTPPQLIKLIGPDRELFLQGRRCENQNLGIGAFVYYRRVVEDQKNRILEQIIKVSEKVGASQQQLAQLEAARAESRFTVALESVKDALPQSLLINGHNPLTLLHSALSEGLHQQTDEECLRIASSVRIVLAELSERLAQALKDEAELKLAVSRLVSQKK